MYERSRWAVHGDWDVAGGVWCLGRRGVVTLHIVGVVVDIGWPFRAIPDVARRVWNGMEGGGGGQRNAEANVGWGLLTFKSRPVWEGVGGRRRIKVDNSALNIEFKRSLKL